MRASLQLSRALLENTGLSEEHLAQALRKQEETGRRLTDLLLDLELLPEAELLGVLGSLFDIPVRENLRPDEVDAELVSELPIGFVKRHCLLPMRMDGNELEVAIADPLLVDPLDDLRVLFPGVEVRPALVGRREILNCINQVYDRGAHAGQVAEGLSEDDLQDLASEIIHEPQDLLDSGTDDAPVVRLVNSLLHQAVKERASDIHVEPQERELVVRFRTDDVLYEPIRPLPKRLQHAVTSRIKIMGRLDIAEKRLPQDGRIPLKIAGRDYDCRLSTLPTQFGERVVLRLLPRNQELLSIERIGLDKRGQGAIRQLVARAHGIVLVSGPTGSGKTTTLYAALAEINSPDINIITVEDPVEIQLEGIGQIEVREGIGLSFAAGLRSILRQDPDVILVGEIRDLETAEIAIQASLTGHLVLSTIHTNDSAGAVTRLIDLGVEPFLISSSLIASLAQRLVRKLCVHCRETYEPTPAELSEIGLTRGELSGHRIYRSGPGCARCNQSGFYERTAIYEILAIDDDIRRLVAKGIDSKTIQQEALRKGMKTMRMHGAEKVLEGVTSIAEVLRQTEEEASQALDALPS